MPYLPLDAFGQFDLSAFDLVLSYTGGEALEKLRSKLGARAWRHCTVGWTRKSTIACLRPTNSSLTSPIWEPTRLTGINSCTSYYWFPPRGARNGVSP